MFLDGDWVGVCADSESFVAELKSCRRQNELPRQVQKFPVSSIRLLLLGFSILNGQNFLCRCKSRRIKIKKKLEFSPEQYSFQRLLDQGVAELIGIEEEEDCHTAWGNQTAPQGTKELHTL